MGSPDTSIQHQVCAGWSGDTGFDQRWPDYNPYADDARSEATTQIAPKLMTYGPDRSNIGAFIRDRKGRVFEVIDETPDGRWVIVQDGFGDSQIDLADGYRIVE